MKCQDCYRTREFKEGIYCSFKGKKVKTDESDHNCKRGGVNQCTVQNVKKR